MALEEREDYKNKQRVSPTSINNKNSNNNDSLFLSHIMFQALF